MFRVNWEKKCHECGNPINVKTILQNFKTFFYLRNFATHKPFCMMGNLPMIKYYGNMKCRRVCLACYFSPRNHLDHLRQREIGKVIKIDRLKSKTRDEIYDWFEDFDGYRKRKDIDDCLMPHLGAVPGLNIYLLRAFDGEGDSDQSHYN